MKFSQIDLYEVEVLNDNNELVTTIENISSSMLYYDKSLNTYMLSMEDAFLDLNFLKFIGVENEASEKEEDSEIPVSISIKRNNEKMCKINARGLMAESKTYKTSEVTVEITSAKLYEYPKFLGGRDSNFKVVFKINPVCDEFFKINIESLN